MGISGVFVPRLLSRFLYLDFAIVMLFYGEAVRGEIQLLLLDKANPMEELPCSASGCLLLLLASSPGHQRSQRSLFLEKIITSLALQDVDRIHEVRDLHQRNWTALRPTSSLIFSQLALGSPRLSWSSVPSPRAGFDPLSCSPVLAHL